MGWKISRFASSLVSLLRESGTDPAVAADIRLENARDAMLDLLQESLDGKVVRPAVWGKVLYARDIESLWYHRSDVMALLSVHLGENEARRRVTALTPLFKEMQLGRKPGTPDRSDPT
ncbi:MAG TPA: hypothetical protein PLL83_02405 [Rhodoferax sp.]|jgi:hypothetical protein|nr:hypothetical protein [Rhodoferax sp.]HPW83202.1 hypothetical protein [Rhodoferax sp.]HQC84611.1 hypothetical protein [Rhodoferax sp.]HQY75416.1 hypothetical protein [Rhodoferax sp.]